MAIFQLPDFSGGSAWQFPFYVGGDARVGHDIIVVSTFCSRA